MCLMSSIKKLWKGIFSNKKGITVGLENSGYVHQKRQVIMYQLTVLTPSLHSRYKLDLNDFYTCWI